VCINGINGFRSDYNNYWLWATMCTGSASNNIYYMEKYYCIEWINTKHQTFKKR